MNKDYFYFKDFALRNRDAALKINTDGVLLAAWADVENAIRVLDIGTAGGVVAFIVAKRNSAARITGIDICSLSIQEALFNKYYNLSLGANIVFLNESLKDQTAQTHRKYDHIVSNPPFFEIDKSYTSALTSKQLAKHDYSLSFVDLLNHSSKILTENGVLSLIINYKEERELEKVCLDNGFFISRMLIVSGKSSKPPNRLLLELTKKETFLPSQKNSLTIRKEDNSYTEDYKLLTKDLYLNF